MAPTATDPPARLIVATLLAAFLAVAVPSPAWPQSGAASITGLSAGFVLETAGRLTTAPDQVISGTRSILGEYGGSGSYTPYLRTEPAALPLSPGHTYRVSFAYRILRAPSRGFEVLFYSPTGGAQGSWLPSYTIRGADGDSGTATLQNTLGNFRDYQARWNIVGTGAIVIDDIVIRDVGESTVFAMEDAEPSVVRLAQAFLPEAVVGRGFWVAPAVTGGTAPYVWSIRAGELPPGLRLEASGQVLGKPTTAGRYVLSAGVADASGSTSEIRLTLQVRPAAQPVPRPRPLTFVDKSADPLFSGLPDRRAVVVQPLPYPGAFRNPLKGMRPSVDSTRSHPFATLGRKYIEWNLLENQESDTVERIRKVTDSVIGDLPAYNIKVIPRVYLKWPPDQEYWPADLTPGDYRSPAFRARMARLIERLGQVWNNDPRIAYVETGIIGDWGEQHDPGFPSLDGPDPLSPDQEKQFGDAYQAAFPDKLIMHRYPRDLVAYPFGIHWDVFAAFDRGWWGNDSTGMTRELTGPSQLDKWKIAPRGGEIDPTFLDEPDFSERSLQNVVRKYTPRLVELIRNLHWNHLAVLETLDPSDTELWQKASLVQDALGYRFEIKEALYSPRVEPGGRLVLRLRIRNTGASPFYYPWPLQVELLTDDTHRPAWKSLWEGLDLRQWLPDSEVQIGRSFPLPSDLPAGRYILALAILDPAGMVPSARFAVVNYYNGGRTPLGPVGVSVSPGTEELADFDDLQADRSLYYLPGR
jgi:hypothetical protein